MTVSTKHCPSIRQGGQSKGLSGLQRGQPPAGQEGTREVTTRPPGTGTSSQWFILIRTQCRHVHATAPRDGAHLGIPCTSTRSHLQRGRVLLSSWIWPKIPSDPGPHPPGSNGVTQAPSKFIILGVGTGPLSWT